MSAGEIITIVVSVIGCLLGILSWLRDPLKRCYVSVVRNYGYVTNPKFYFEKMKKKREELLELRNNVDAYLSRCSLEEAKKERQWAACAVELSDKLTNRIDIEKYKRQNISDSLKLKSQIKNVRYIEALSGEIDKLVKECQSFNIANPVNASPELKLMPTRGMEILRPSTSLVGHGTKYAIRKMWRYICDAEVRMIGVHGMSGVGKTEVVRHAKIGNLFHGSIIWVRVPYEAELKELQGAIAKKLELDLSSEDLSKTRADKLYDAFEAKLTSASWSGRGILLILDEVWGDFTLKEIGIPEPTEGNGLKIIIVSTCSSVLSAMKVDKIVELTLLPEDEAWELFINESDPYYVSRFTPEIQTIAKQVAKECGGLPSAIITVARGMKSLNSRRNNIFSENDWEKTLTAIKESTVSLGCKNARLWFSYQRLKPNAQLCFLYCAFYPNGHHIETRELMEYWRWEGLLGDVRSTEDNMREAERILYDLKNFSLLESISQEVGIEQVKMHPVIRNMAINIATECWLLIKAGLRYRKPPLINTWPIDLKRASLMRNDLEDLPYEPKCPNLSLLLLQHNPLDGGFCDNFFDGMPNLNVLDLSYTGVHKLPKSLFSLKNLRVLFLRNCWNLTSLPSLSELVALMVLDLSDTHIRELPQGMDKLIALKCLNLSRTFVETFPPGLLVAFEHLQELLMDGCGFLWGSESLICACTKELTFLQSTIILELSFCNTQAFQEYVNSRHCNQLERFKFSVGGLYRGKSGKNSVAFIGVFPTNRNPIMLPKHTFELHVMGCNSVTQLTVPSLENLKIVEVSNCTTLKYLFKRGMLHNVPNIEEIAIKHCPDIVEVIEQEEGGSIIVPLITFPKLQKLVLFDAPNLKSIYRSIVVCDSLQTIDVWKCNELKRFPVMVYVDDEQKLLSPRGLKDIRGERAWLEQFECDLPHAKTLLQQFFIQVTTPDEILTRTGQRSSPKPEIASMQDMETGNSNKGKAKIIDESSSKGTTMMEPGSSSGIATMKSSRSEIVEIEPDYSNPTQYFQNAKAILEEFHSRGTAAMEASNSGIAKIEYDNYSGNEQ